MNNERNATSALTFDRRSFLKAASYVTAATAAGAGFNLLGQSSRRYTRILVPADAHPALHSAATLLAAKIGLDQSAIAPYSGAAASQANAIVFALKESKGVPAPLSRPIERDGYSVMAQNGGLMVCGGRPRSLLFAAGEPHHWLSRAAGVWVRNPAFALRFGSYSSDHSVAEQAAILGANCFTASMRSSISLRDAMPEVYAELSADARNRLDGGGEEAMSRNAALVKEFHDADLTVFAELPYGNNFSRWSPAVYEAFLAVYPSAKGVPEPRSWEKAALCPSDPATWKLMDAYVGEIARQSQADGVAATFWDQYGMFCHDPRCRKNGLDQFKNELYESVSRYYNVLHPLGQKLHLRTWSSGCPHWLGDEYVHAPGYGQFSESHYELWSRVIKETPAEIFIQTKVYHSDCEPDPRFTTLLGKCKPHTEIVEYQIVGQTIGRHYFPTSTVNFTASTLKKSLALVGPEGGAEITAGGTMQTNYDIYADILNSSNVYAWRELTWDVNADVNKIWADWSAQIYSPTAAPRIARALAMSEEVLYRTFSPLGFGSDTNSGFVGDIARRETLLRYTNRNYLPEYAKYLEPTKENIQLIVEEKQKCLQGLDAMLAELDAAKPYLTKAQLDELTTRFDWLQQYAVCNTTLDISLWRYRYLRALHDRLTTDPGQLKPLAEAYDQVREHAPLLFRFDPALKFSCYSVPLGQLRRKPGLGSPLPLMHEMYTKALAGMEDSVGPDYLPQNLIRT